MRQAAVPMSTIRTSSRRAGACASMTAHFTEELPQFTASMGFTFLSATGGLQSLTEDARADAAARQ
jgi:hypothetical protein